MDTSRIIRLISVEYKTDSLKQSIPVEVSRTLFCRLSSVSASEFFDAGQTGIEAAYRVIVLRAEYRGETTAEIDGVRYGIYRTYQTGTDRIELYLERKAGT